MEVPSLLRQAVSFISAEAVWLTNGRPFRDVMDINHIYYQVCTPCEYFENHGCRVCGCRIVPHERSPLNKVSLGTTNCPHPEGPKWVSEITPPDDVAPEVYEAALKNSKAVLVEVTPPIYQPAVGDGKKKVVDAVAVNPFTRTSTGQFVQED